MLNWDEETGLLLLLPSRKVCLISHGFIASNLQSQYNIYMSSVANLINVYVWLINVEKDWNQKMWISKNADTKLHGTVSAFTLALVTSDNLFQNQHTPFT